MEEEVKIFLKRVMLTVFVSFFWMAINSTLGIFFNLAFVDESVSIGNVLFYAWFVASSFFLIRYLVRLWNKPIDGLNH